MGGEDPSADAGTGTAAPVETGHRRPASGIPPTPSIIGSALQSRPHDGHAAEAVLDKLNRGVVIFDAEARVRFVNDAGLRILRDTAAFAIADGRLSLRDPALQARFGAFLLRGRERAGGGEEQSPVAMRVDTADGRAPLRILLSPLVLPSDRIAGHREPQYVLMIYEPHAGRHVPKRILQELYGMSDAEADLVVCLFEGESLEAASRRLHISLNTAKTHLQHVFRKCDVHSQGELLQLLSLGPRTT
jgi:DNA-binding CsgD family transcriptional regulator